MYRKKLQDTPKEFLNWRLFFGVVVFGLMGAARGLDEGLIGQTTSQKSFIHEYGLKDPSLSKEAQANRLSNITSMVQLGSIGGCLIAFYLSDKLGRLRATQELCLLWIVGAIIFVTSNGRLGQIYAGRLIMGLGVGQTVVVAPTYLAEIAPKSIRGLCTTIFAGNVYFGIMLGYFASYGTKLHVANNTARQWIIPTSLHFIFAGCIFIASFFSLESPRWLLKVGRQEDALLAMGKLRGMHADDALVRQEVADVETQLEEERESVKGASWWGVIKELTTIKSNVYRLYIGIGTQLLSQWSGASSITIYATEYFTALNVASTSAGILTVPIFGVVKFVAALSCAFFLIDFIGRKRSLFLGITVQFTAMLYIGIYMLANPSVGASSATHPISQSPSQKRAGIAAIVMVYFSGIGWALGWNSIQYLINAEIFPLRLRSIGTSVVMVLHFANQYGNTKAVPSMFLRMGVGGTLIFFAAITLIGLAWVYLSIPELAGLSLEDVDRAFQLPWFSIGRRGGAVGRRAASAIAIAEAEDRREELEKQDAVQIERVGSWDASERGGRRA